MLLFLGIVAGGLSTLAFWPYLRDTAKGRTQPHRASWLIWSILASISLGSQVYEGASHSLWFSAVQTGGTTLVLALAFVFGRGTLLARGDGWILVLAALGLALWHVTETSAYALAISISISLLGGCAVVAKTLKAPHGETLAFWGLSFVASVFAILSIGRVDWLLLAYPIYLFVLNGAVLAAILLGRTRPALHTA